MTKCSAQTIRRRLKEFHETPSAALETRQFLDVELEEREPPPFIKNKKPLKVERLQQSKQSSSKCQDANEDVIADMLMEEFEERCQHDGIVLQAPKARQLAAMKKFAQLFRNSSSKPFVSADDAQAIGYEHNTLDDLVRYTNTSVPLAAARLDSIRSSEYRLPDRLRHMKSRMWLKRNNTFLKQKAELQRRAIEAESLRQQAVPATESAGGGDEPSAKRRRTMTRRGGKQPIANAQEAMRAMTAVSKKLSETVDYERLKEIFGHDMQSTDMFA